MLTRVSLWNPVGGAVHFPHHFCEPGPELGETSYERFARYSTTKLQTQLDRLNTSVNEQAQSMKAVAINARRNPAIAYVQNLRALTMHGLRADDATIQCAYSRLDPGS